MRPRLYQFKNQHIASQDLRGCLSVSMKALSMQHTFTSVCAMWKSLLSE